jgi:hypothetical protein
VTVLAATDALRDAGIAGTRIVWLRGGSWCAYGWQGDRCLTTYADAAGDALAQLLGIAQMRKRCAS